MDEVCIPDIHRILSISHQTIDLFSTWCEDLEVHLNSKYSGFPNDKIIQIMKRLTDYKPNPVFPMINRLFHLLTDTILRVVEHEEMTATPTNRHFSQNLKQKIQRLISKDRSIKPIPSFDEDALSQYLREIKDLKKVLKQHKQIFQEIQKQQEVCWVAKSKMTKYELCLATANSSRSHLSDKLPEKELKARDKYIGQLQSILDEKVNIVAEASQKYARLLAAEKSTRLKMKQMESKLLADIKFGLTERLYCGLSSLKQILSTKSDQRPNKLLSEVLDIESSMSSLASSIIDTFCSKYKHCNPQKFHQDKGFNVRLPDCEFKECKDVLQNLKTTTSKQQDNNNNNNSSEPCACSGFYLQNQAYLQREKLTAMNNKSECFINISAEMIVKQKIATESSSVVFGWVKQKPWFVKKYRFFYRESVSI